LKYIEPEPESRPADSGPGTDNNIKGGGLTRGIFKLGRGARVAAATELVPPMPAVAPELLAAAPIPFAMIGLSVNTVLVVDTMNGLDTHVCLFLPLLLIERTLNTSTPIARAKNNRPNTMPAMAPPGRDLVAVPPAVLAAAEDCT